MARQKTTSTKQTQVKDETTEGGLRTGVLHAQHAAFIKDKLGVDVSPEQVFAVYSTRVAFRKSDTYRTDVRGAKAEAKAAAETAKAEARAKREEERKAKAAKKEADKKAKAEKAAADKAAAEKTAQSTTGKGKGKGKTTSAEAIKAADAGTETPAKGKGKGGKPGRKPVF